MKTKLYSTAVYNTQYLEFNKINIHTFTKAGNRILNEKSHLRDTSPEL